MSTAAPPGAEPLVGAAPPSGPPPSGLRARLRVRLAARRSRGRVTADPGAAAGPGVRWDLGPGARVHLGAGCAIGGRTRLHVRDGEVRIGAGAVLGERCVVQVGTAAEVGARARLADEVVLVDHEPVADAVEAPIRRQGVRAAPIHVDDDVRIGPRTLIGAGVHVGAGAQVSAGLTVLADVPAGARVDGTAAAGASAPTRPTAP